MARGEDAKGGCGLAETELFAVSGRIPLIPCTQNPQQFHFLSRGSPNTSGFLKCPPERKCREIPTLVQVSWTDSSI